MGRSQCSRRMAGDVTVFVAQFAVSDRVILNRQDLKVISAAETVIDEIIVIGGESYFHELLPELSNNYIAKKRNICIRFFSGVY